MIWKSTPPTESLVRLNVLRSIISEASNASKGPSPVKTDLQVLAILRKKASASKAAAQEFAENQREDLKQRQEAEIKVLDEYAGQVETISEEEIFVAVDEVVRSIGEQGGTINAGQLMKELFKPGGKLKDKPVEKGRVAQMIKTRLT